MAKTLKQILGGENLTGVVQSVSTGVPSDMLPTEFLTLTRPVDGNSATYRKVEGTRQTARLAMYGSPSQQRALSGLIETPVTLLHTVESIHHDPTTLVNLKQFDNPAKQRLGEDEVARQTGQFAALFDNLRICAVYSMLRYGAIYYDGSGNLLPTSSGAVVTVDYQVPANNKDQLNGIIGASWATASTDIIGDIAALKKAARKATGYPLRHAFYGENILGYLLTNTKIKELVNRNAGMQEAAARGEIPQGLLGFAWHPIYEAFFNDADGTDQDWWDGDAITFTPDITRDLYEVFEGSYPVPTDVGAVTNDAVDALGNVAVVNGKFSYGLVMADPVTIKQVAGDTFLPILKVPAAFYLADVTP